MDDDATYEDERDPALDTAGARLRSTSRQFAASEIEVKALRRRSRRRGALAGIAAGVAVVAVVGGALLGTRTSGGKQVASVTNVAGNGPVVDRIMASLGSKPIDPTKVHLVRTVETFDGCDALLGDLRRVGAAHVGSRGFGASYGLGYERFEQVGLAIGADKASADGAVGGTAAPQSPAGETLGTNVQVSGVDELDGVKADGRWIYDLDGHGNLRITDSTTLQVASTLRIVPDPSAGSGGTPPDTTDSLDSLLEAGGRLAVFGSRTVTSKPVAGDPSATQSSTQYLTVTFVDATDPAKPRITDQVQIEGALVSARLVKGQIRLVTTSNMADLGFVVPTTPTSIPKALDRNRRSVAASTVGDWIPEWQRSGGDARPLVPCDRVHVPTTFAGVAMTSLVSFPIGSGRFAPAATSILAPGDTLYAGTDDVAISSQVWVDPVDRGRLSFDDWRTAIHEFSFATDGPPVYDGSGIVDGSTVGQFAFGAVGDGLGVVTTKGTPWEQKTSNAVNLTVLKADGKGGLAARSKVDDLAGGKGSVEAVRFTDGRILVSIDAFPHESIRVVDVSDPARPRIGGSVTMDGRTGYFHPLDGHRALLVGSRTDRVAVGDREVPRDWVRAQILDTSDPDHPRITATWETPWAIDEVGSDHHAFTYWPDRKLGMWGVRSTNPGAPQNHAVTLSIDGGVSQAAFPVAAPPPEVPAPCPRVAITDPDVRRMVGKDGVVLACGDRSRRSLDWPRYVCSAVGKGLVERYAPDQVDEGSVFLCHPAPQPTVSRVLVVNGRPILLTDQTLEALDPKTFASTRVVYHPTGGAP